MSNNNGIDINELLAMQALTESQNDNYGAFSEYDDDDDDDSFDTLYEEDDDDDDDDESVLGFADEDDDDDDLDSFDDSSGFSDRRRYRRRRRRLFAGRRRYKGRRLSRVRPIRGTSRTVLRSASGQHMKVSLGKRFASSTEVNKLVKSIDKKFAAALKERRANHDRLSKQIVANSKTLNARIKRVDKAVDELKKQAQTTALMGMLQGSPKVETITLRSNGDDNTLELDKALKADIKFEKQDMLLPLLMSGGLGGSDSSDNNMMLLALALGNK